MLLEYDVQARNVEFDVDVELQFIDGNFPLEFRFSARQQ